MIIIIATFVNLSLSLWSNMWIFDSNINCKIFSKTLTSYKSSENQHLTNCRIYQKNPLLILRKCFRINVSKCSVHCFVIHWRMNISRTINFFTFVNFSFKIEIHSSKLVLNVRSKKLWISQLSSNIFWKNLKNFKKMTFQMPSSLIFNIRNLIVKECNTTSKLSLEQKKQSLIIYWHSESLLELLKMHKHFSHKTCSQLNIIFDLRRM